MVGGWQVAAVDCDECYLAGCKQSYKVLVLVYGYHACHVDVDLHHVQ